MTLTSQERAQAEHERKTIIDDLKREINECNYEINACREYIKENNEKVEELKEQIKTLVFENRNYAKLLVDNMGNLESIQNDLHDIETISAETLAQ